MNNNTNVDIKWEFEGADLYSIFNGIDENDIMDIYYSILNPLEEQYKVSIGLYSDDIKRMLNKDEELRTIAIETYTAYPENENWKEEYKQTYRQSIIDKRAPGYGIIKNSLIRDKITKIIMDEVNKALIEKQINDEKIKQLFSTAKQTGEKQLISQWLEPCNDKREECNLDVCQTWAMPDGTTKETRNHTW